jgi:hypothetical protein
VHYLSQNGLLELCELEDELRVYIYIGRNKSHKHSMSKYSCVLSDTCLCIIFPHVLNLGTNGGVC